MSWKNDLEEFMVVLSKLSSKDSEQKPFVFKEKYQILVVDQWNPLPDTTLCLSKKAYIVFGNDQIPNEKKHASEKPERKTNGSTETADFYGDLLLHSNFVCDFSVFEQTGIQAFGILSDENRLSIADARFICELYTRIPDSTMKSIPMYAMCDEKDKKNTILLGTSGHFRIIGCSKGFLFTEQDYPNMNDVMSKHLQGFPNSSSELRHQNSFYSYYEISKTVPPSELVVLKPISEGCLAIECRGTVIPKLLHKPAESSCCTMVLQAVQGNECEGAFARYKELKFLEALHESFPTGVMTWPAEKSTSSVSDTLKEFFKGLKKDHSMKLPAFLDYFTATSESHIALVSHVTSNRKDMDFTDYMWLILMGCRSHQELKDALIFIFNELKSLLHIPYIHDKNETEMACLAKQPTFYTCTMITSTKAIQMLLEIGIEKLSRDYVSIFVGLNLGPYSSFHAFLEASEGFDSTIRSVQKLHTILELLIITSMNFQLTNLDLASMIRIMLDHYSSVETVDPAFKFRFPISLHSAQNVLQKMKPTVWQATLTTICSNYKKHTALIFNKDSNAATQKTSSSPVPDRNVYECSLLTCIFDTI